MSGYNSEYDSDEYTQEDIQIIEKWKKISHFTIEDYLNCKETRGIILRDWEERLSENLEHKVQSIFNNHREHLQKSANNVLFYADESHSNDLMKLINYHLVKNYSTDSFKENPDLASPILANIELLKEQRAQAKKMIQQQKFQKANKKFNWFDKTK